mmetsp:Transcript_28883/g.44145  ORF Transcript_28883/g.44145 Transcript_28883/m.44145 type:complete len:128 (+) Transcript_28883:746-1129(+)|eukprot:CAMPEP_0194124030 /NCGR_PEP_ID=MMETSP0150-20130528/56973_1 /TAXON_ID=122233 /ORGANISM="Chaetoceros debilis, Strain MM31A-1" /LENGTH=127 /DNA_ID=CAMNT_0038817549 /DNA_START=724 /DNA_END=1107 /DNA_ORIENTATION=+
MMEQSDRALSWEVREELREAFGIHYSDKRSTRSQLEARWQNVNFGDLSEEDEAWKSDERETIENVECRIDYFLKWLLWNSSSTRTNTHTNTKYQIKCSIGSFPWSMDGMPFEEILSITYGGWNKAHL